MCRFSTCEVTFSEEYVNIQDFKEFKSHRLIFVNLKDKSLKNLKQLIGRLLSLLPRNVHWVRGAQPESGDPRQRRSRSSPDSHRLRLHLRSWSYRRQRSSKLSSKFLWIVFKICYIRNLRYSKVYIYGFQNVTVLRTSCRLILLNLQSILIFWIIILFFHFRPCCPPLTYYNWPMSETLAVSFSWLSFTPQIAWA